VRKIVNRRHASLIAGAMLEIVNALAASMAV
jgi:hypothetical protein